MPYISFLFCLFVDNLIDMWLYWNVQYYVGSFISVNIVIDRPIFVGTHCIGISVYFDVDWIWTEIYYIAIKIFEQKNIVREEQTQNEWMQTTTEKPLFICFKLFFISSNISVFMQNCEKYHITPQWKKIHTASDGWIEKEWKRTKVCKRAANNRKSIYKNLPEAAKCQLEHAPYSSINGI